ncbi:putative glutamine amidotransferase [Rubidibacter lacunae KORDI 51-2]|uniref:Putative glutamine amidotransferase n=2 Tax=Rubidibacter TaxID=582491 RepID=U5DRH1_9CHRO|nr:putative glutamine amidotransferase [Rubidibacter lacunae KORDI 51-2]
MCRLVGYLGPSLKVDRLVCEPPHSLVAQAYQPREMELAILNADGFGIGWFGRDRSAAPFSYRSVMPIWTDPNLTQLARYIESECFVGYVRSATPGLAVDISNCQPFTTNGLLLPSPLLFLHNGYIENFRQTLYRDIRMSLSGDLYRFVHGTTDSEHIFALILHELEADPTRSIAAALERALATLTALAREKHVGFCANILLSDGTQLVASRYACGTTVPSLYWLNNAPELPDAIAIASEPLFEGPWQRCPEHSIIQAGGPDGRAVRIHSIV